MSFKYIGIIKEIHRVHPEKNIFNLVFNRRKKDWDRESKEYKSMPYQFGVTAFGNIAKSINDGLFNIGDRVVIEFRVEAKTVIKDGTRRQYNDVIATSIENYHPDKQPVVVVIPNETEE